MCVYVLCGDKVKSRFAIYTLNSLLFNVQKKHRKQRTGKRAQRKSGDMCNQNGFTLWLLLNRLDFVEKNVEMVMAGEHQNRTAEK